MKLRAMVRFDIISEIYNEVIKVKMLLIWRHYRCIIAPVRGCSHIMSAKIRDVWNPPPPHLPEMVRKWLIPLPFIRNFQTPPLCQTVAHLKNTSQKQAGVDLYMFGGCPGTPNETLKRF